MLFLSLIFTQALNAEGVLCLAYTCYSEGTVIMCLVENPEFQHFAYIVLFLCCFQDNLLLSRTKAEYMHKGQGGIPGTCCLVFTFIARVEVILVYKSSIFSAFVTFS